MAIGKEPPSDKSFSSMSPMSATTEVSREHGEHSKNEERRRAGKEEVLMRTAHLMAERSTCRRNRVGAVLALDGRIISSGYGGAPSGMEHCSLATCTEAKPCTRTVHAEANTIAFAARHGVSTEGAILFTTLSPCIECAKLLINAGIRGVVWYEQYRDILPLAFLDNVGIWTREYGVT